MGLQVVCCCLALRHAALGGDSRMNASQYFSDAGSDTIPVNAYCVVCVSIPEHKVVQVETHAGQGLDRRAAQMS